VQLGSQSVALFDDARIGSALSFTPCPAFSKLFAHLVTDVAAQQ